MRGTPLLPVQPAPDADAADPDRANLFKTSYFDAEFRAGLGYNQPASPLSSAGVVAAATGATVSKYVARRETPVYIAENCTQCMECITACPDTALPNTAQDFQTILKTAITHYVADKAAQTALIGHLPAIEEAARAKMVEVTDATEKLPFKDIIKDQVGALNGAVTDEAKSQLDAILDVVPIAYNKVPAVFRNIEKKKPGEGGLFSIFVSDLCKGCRHVPQPTGGHQRLTGLHCAQVEIQLSFAGQVLPGQPGDGRQIMQNRAQIAFDSGCARFNEKSAVHGQAGQ